MSRESDLLKRIEKLEARNLRVETDKAWETSLARKAGIMALTYLVVVAYLHFVVRNDNPLINAIVPVLGFLLSTLTMGMLKNYWLNKR